MNPKDLKEGKSYLIQIPGTAGEIWAIAKYRDGGSYSFPGGGKIIFYNFKIERNTEQPICECCIRRVNNGQIIDIDERQIQFMAYPIPDYMQEFCELFFDFEKEDA